jgi:hypothetical protein
MEAQGDTGADSGQGGIAWPSSGPTVKFWAVPANPAIWGDQKGWVIYRSHRRGIVYYEELALGGPMPDWLALRFLQGILNMEKRVNR